MLPKQLQLVLVTPEKTLLDEPVDALRFPLYDGQIGILPGRAPLVGRLGYGELKITRGSTITRYYIDGGFVQIKNSVVTLLTNQAVPAAAINETAAAERLAEAKRRKPTTDAAFAAKSRDIERARQMLSVASK